MGGSIVGRHVTAHRGPGAAGAVVITERRIVGLVTTSGSGFSTGGPRLVNDSATGNGPWMSTPADEPAIEAGYLR